MDHDAEELTLRTLSCTEPSLPAIHPLPVLNNRKRPFLPSRGPSFYEDQLATATSTSSDPALFSSDETPDAENYSSGMKRRKKKTFTGTWWGDELRETRASQSEKVDGTTKKRQFRRNYDSGIFMADDSSCTDLSSAGSLEQELLDAQEEVSIGNAKRNADEIEGCAAENKRKVHQSFKFTTEAALKRLPQGRPIDPKDHMIRRVVQNCLDNNDENVDWTGMRLDYLPPAVTDLKSLIKRINSQALNTKLAPFEAELKIYLGNNNFSQFPQPLLELANIRLLSMRQNNLTSLPPGIRTLVNLQELNIASNNLQCLPYEIFQLLRHGALKTIHPSPNPWMPLPPVKDRFLDAPPLMLVTANKGSFCRLVISKPTEVLPNGTQQQKTDLSRTTSKQSHLSEMVLRTLLRHNTAKTDLSTYLSEEHPQSARKLLGILHSAQLSGGHICTFCGRHIVLPRYQWYEWWDMLYDMNVPEKMLSLEPPSTTEVGEIRLGETHANHPMLKNTDIDVKESTLERLLPFQRMACGCIDVRTGLEMEQESGETAGALGKRRGE